MKKELRYLVPEDYMADPAVHVFNGRVYIYPSHDWESGIPENDNGDLPAFSMCLYADPTFLQAHHEPIVSHYHCHALRHHAGKAPKDTFHQVSSPLDATNDTTMYLHGKRYTPSSESGTYPVGVYEGAGYSAKGIYRPADNCRMRTNEYPTFCPVCQRAICRVIEFYTE